MENVTVLNIGGTDYEFGWEYAELLHGPVTVDYVVSVNTASVYNHITNERMSWEGFAHDTMWFYTPEDIAEMIHEQEIEMYGRADQFKCRIGVFWC